jgi:hypothetical protein
MYGRRRPSWLVPISVAGVLGLVLVACGGGGGEPVDPCSPNPCSQVPSDSCVGNAVTSFRPVCADNAGEPDCSYEVGSSRDCGLQKCDPETAACVACLQDADCPVQGLLCRDKACVQPCVPDAREVNDSSAQATPLRGNEDWPGLSLCEGDQDWFRIPLTATAELTTHLAYDPSAGALQLVLLGPDGASEVASATSVADGLQLVHTVDADGTYFVRVTAAAEAWNSYRLTISVTGGSDPCMPDPCTDVPPTECVGDQLVSYRGECSDAGGEAQCAYAVDQSVDCTAQGQHCDPAGLTCVACVSDDQCAAGERCIAGSCADDPCLPDPCTQVPVPACLGEVLTSYRGACEAVDGSARCTYPEDQISDCAALGLRCDPASPACVECLTDAECAWPFEVCQASACAAGCQDDAREPNGSAASATDITANVSLLNLVLCSGDQDWYRLDLAVGDALIASAVFDPAQGDLDVFLIAADGVTVVASATGPGVPAALAHTIQPGEAGGFYLRVEGVGGAQAIYSLTTSTSGDPCVPNPCTAVPPAACLGQELTTYRADCTDQGGLPACAYPVDQVVDCAAQGQLCDAAAPACVDCLADADCSWPFEVCQAGACAAGCRDDADEPNDGAAQATAIQPDGLRSDLVLCSGDEDWYQATLEEGDRLEVLLGFTHTDGNLDLDLLGPDGVSVVASAHGGADDELIDFTLPAGAGGAYYLRVFGVAGAHNRYSLLTARTDDPCLPSPCNATPAAACQGETLLSYSSQCLPDGLGGASCSYPQTQTDCLLQGLRCDPASPACVGCLTTADCSWPFEVCQAMACVAGCQDDAREQDDSAAQASALTSGQVVPNLVECGNDDDWFSVSLDPQQTLRGRIDFTHAAGDLSLQIVGPNGSTVLATSATSNNFEEAAATNTTAGSATHYVRVYGAAGAHNVYQVSATVLPDPCTPEPCTAVPPAQCVGNVLTTYQGVCANDLGAASCSYPVAGQQDCSTTGGLCQSAACVGRFADVGDLVITEIMYNPAAVADNLGEWFEVQNRAAVPVNLRALEAHDLANNAFTISTDLLVEPGAFAVLGNNSNTGTNGGAPVDYAYAASFALNNSGSETVTLRRGTDVVDAVGYCIGAAPCISSGVSGTALQLDPDHADPVSNDLVEYWCLAPAGSAYGLGDLGTPGAVNEPCGVRTFTLGWCNVQWPASLDAAAGTVVGVFSRVWIDGLTNLDPIGVDPAAELVVQLGYGPQGADPVGAPGSWSWFGAWPNPAWDGTAAGEPNNDEYLGEFPAPPAGDYHYAFRYSGDHGATWSVCDLDGFWDGSGAPVLTSN